MSRRSPEPGFRRGEGATETVGKKNRVGFFFFLNFLEGFVLWDGGDAEALELCSGLQWRELEEALEGGIGALGAVDRGHGELIRSGGAF